jgi:transposase-like protein
MDKYLSRALDSTGQTIEFLLMAKRDKHAAKRFLVKAIEASGNPMPRVINVDKNPAYPAAMEVLKADGVIPGRVRLRPTRQVAARKLSTDPIDSGTPKRSNRKHA